MENRETPGVPEIGQNLENLIRKLPSSALEGVKGVFEKVRSLATEI